jgi:hypothetical protein
MWPRVITLFKLGSVPLWFHNTVQSVISWRHLRTTVFAKGLEVGKECCEKSCSDMRYFSFFEPSRRVCPC